MTRSFRERLAVRAKRLKSDVPAVFLALKAPGTPWYARVLAAFTVAYALSPIDLIPDFIPVLGYLDDLLLLPFLAACTIKLIPPEIFAACRAQADGLWNEGKPKHWYYGIPIVLAWGLALALLLKALL